MITAKQAVDRAKGLGSSDIPALLGLSKYTTPYDLWLVKTGQAPGPDENDAMALGTHLEAGVLKLAGDRLGVKVVKPKGTFVGAHPFMLANVDGMVGVAKRGSPIVEAKVTGVVDDWGDEGSGEVPPAVEAQVMWQMICSSSALAHVASLQGSFGIALKMYRVELDSDYAEYMIERAAAFWNDCVLARSAPRNTGPSAEMVRRLKRDESLPVVEIDPDLFSAERVAKLALDEAEVAHKEARAHLLAALGNATRGVARAGGIEYAVKVTQVTTERFDAKKFQEANPEEAAKWIVHSGYPRVTVTAKKGGE